MLELAFRGRTVVSDRALIMAIVNRTPDSFYDHGATFAEDRAREAIAHAVAEGADVLDIGGIPASPGPEVTVEEELDRVLPTLEWTREEFPDLVISIDTYRHEVADVVCRAGADLLNDTWQGYDPKMLEVAAKYGAGYVCSHTGGLQPRTDPTRPQYDDVVADVITETTSLAEKAVALGVPREGVLIDPAIDFGKNTYQSLEILGRLQEMIDTGWPVLMAMSTTRTSSARRSASSWTTG
ncbi:dihydropteroate synthase [Saccharopolyspora flava]|uniref:Dihydropteroate synthase n=1 Tax=Saccharopolyspora flava TaxID=95161 RepID=A0A1I6TEQ2_9PSEU|nr:dihydropteroate synthase [Saccharopolyspora flava]